MIRMVPHFAPPFSLARRDCGRSFRSPTAPVARAAWSPARKQSGRRWTAVPFQMGLSRRSGEPCQQDFFDPRHRRKEAYLRVGGSCFKVVCGHPIRIVSVSAIQTLKPVPLPIVPMDKSASGACLRRKGGIDLLSTETFCRRLELNSIFQRAARPQTHAPGNVFAFSAPAHVQLLRYGDSWLAQGNHLIESRVRQALNLGPLAADT